MMIARHMIFTSLSSISEATGVTLLSTGMAAVDRRGLAFEIDR
jgi:hypothetical protein